MPREDVQNLIDEGRYTIVTPLSDDEIREFDQLEADTIGAEAAFRLALTEYSREFSNLSERQARLWESITGLTRRDLGYADHSLTVINGRLTAVRLDR